KYNTISIGGNIVPSTSPDDRSTDLNMISPDIIGGVEVHKANTADMDASGLGGTVNLTLKEAPSGLRMNVGLLTGYNSLSNSINNYEANFHISNRFFNDKLGVMLSGNANIADRDTDKGVVSYDVQGVPNYDAGETFIKPWINSINLESNTEERTRAGGSLLLDWQVSPSTIIKASSFVGYLKQEIFDLSKQYDLDNNYLEYVADDNDQDQLLYSYAIEGRHFILGSILDWGGSRSQSNNESPYRHSAEFRILGAFNNLAVGNSYDTGPPELALTPENVNDYLEWAYFYEGEFRTREANESESSIFLNWEIPYRFGKHVSGNVKAGTKYRVKERFRANLLNERRIDSPEDVNSYLQTYPETSLTEEGFVGRISIHNFLDEDYEPRDFLNNQYELFRIDQHFDPNILPEVYEGFMKDFYWVDNSAQEDDYDTRESIFSSYLMTEINIGRYITFIPGVRYEKTDIEYGAFVAEESPESEVGPRITQYRDTTGYNSYGNFFPQIHLRIKPTDWFDIRLAYTNTISRPDYDDLA
ncbi:MAG: TonB-dependent receptor, partial [Thermodesulfovibrionia bacterium]|nr:TonB-dependent receptor [Thermodesulfovibrionia bacterium]